MVAADLAASFPRLFSRLVLLSPLGLWRDDAPIPLMEMVSGPPEDVPKYLYAHPDSEAARAAQAMPADPAQMPRRSRRPPGTSAAPRSSPGRSPTTASAAGCTASSADAHRLGARGRAGPGGYAKEFGRRIAGSRVEVSDDCGHVVQADQPERSWTAISRFLAS